MATAFHIEDIAIVVAANISRHVMMWLSVGWLVKKNFFSYFVSSWYHILIAQVPAHSALFPLTSF
jgi:hypothetical protein